MHVLRDRASSDSEAVREELMTKLATTSESGRRSLVVPFSLGMKYTNMMSEWNFLSMGMRKIPNLAHDGSGVLPHENIGHWLRKSANRHLPLRRGDIGVIFVPHGADFNWNETMREGIEPLREEFVTADAFSMVDPSIVASAVRDLESRNLRAALLVRIFFMEESFQEKTEYVLGLRRDYRR